MSENQAMTGVTRVPASAQAAAIQSSLTSSERTSEVGSISAVTSSGLTVINSEGHGIGVKYASSTVKNTNSGSIAVGHYAALVGSVSSGYVVADYVSAFTTEPASVSVSGTYEGATGYGIVVKSTDGNIPVMTSSSTSISGTLSVGASVTAKGVGSPSSGILASSLSTAGSSDPTPQVHLLTADYLGSPDGTTSVSASEAAPHLTWAQTSPANSLAYSHVGLKVQVYTNPNHVGTSDPLYPYLTAAAFAHTCAGSDVDLAYDGTKQYITNPESAALVSGYKLYTEALGVGAHIDAIFEDTAGPPGAQYGTICDYSESNWLAGERDMEASIPYDTIFNGLSGGIEEGVLSPSIDLLENPSTIGGTWEHCFANTASDPEVGGWPWIDTENTQLQVTGEGKLFQCMGRDPTDSDAAIRGRLYLLASFLLTYDPNRSILWEEYGTRTGFHVLPESQLVPEESLVPSPSTVASLEKSTGVYAREYDACYLDGKLVSACAVVVNSDFSDHVFPRLSKTYTHTLELSGWGILEGGTASPEGPAPPAAGATFASLTAYVLFQ